MSDPHIPAVDHGDFRMTAIMPDEAFAGGIDCAVTRNCFKGISARHLFRL